MLVIGSRGWTSMQGQFLGSVVTAAARPVVMVRGVAAARHAVPLHVVHAAEAKPLNGPMVTLREPRDRYAGWSAKYHDVAVEAHIAHERDVAGALNSTVPGTQLIVVGSRGHNRFTAGVLGSTTGSLLAQAVCPVTIVPCQVGTPYDI